MTFTRLSAAVSLIGILAACGGGGDPSVRNGPQAVHPSPSALAQRGNVGTPTTQTAFSTQQTPVQAAAPNVSNRTPIAVYQAGFAGAIAVAAAE